MLEVKNVRKLYDYKRQVQMEVLCHIWKLKSMVSFYISIINLLIWKNINSYVNPCD